MDQFVQLRKPLSRDLRPLAFLRNSATTKSESVLKTDLVAEWIPSTSTTRICRDGFAVEELGSRQAFRPSADSYNGARFQCPVGHEQGLFPELPWQEVAALSVASSHSQPSLVHRAAEHFGKLEEANLTECGAMAARTELSDYGGQPLLAPGTWARSRGQWRKEGREEAVLVATTRAATNLAVRLAHGCHGATHLRFCRQ